MKYRPWQMPAWEIYVSPNGVNLWWRWNAREQRYDAGVQFKRRDAFLFSDRYVYRTARLPLGWRIVWPRTDRGGPHPRPEAR